MKQEISGKYQKGFSIMEVVIFIIVVSIGLAGVLKIFNQSTKSSVDPQIQKQALLIAEALLDEISLQPFTWCDSDDANVETATSTAGCATLANAIGPESGETRGSGFDHVDDYNGYTSTGANNALNSPITGLSQYNVSVTVISQALGTIPAADSLKISVSVTHPSGNNVILQGWRARYAPNAGL